DEETMRSADFIVDFGPGPGVRGGQVVAAGTYEDIVGSSKSLTGQYLAGARQIPVPAERRPRTKKRLKIIGARHNNLKNIDVEIPLGLFVGVSGVSGSGKSSLINDILKEGLLQRYRKVENGRTRKDRESKNGKGSENGEANSADCQDSTLDSQSSLLDLRFSP